MQLDECITVRGAARRDRARHGAVAALAERGKRTRSRRSRRAQARHSSASCRAATIRGCAPQARVLITDIGFDGYAWAGSQWASPPR